MSLFQPRMVQCRFINILHGMVKIESGRGYYIRQAPERINGPLTKRSIPGILIHYCKVSDIKLQEPGEYA